MNGLLQVTIIAILCVILQPRIAFFAYLLLLGISITEKRLRVPCVGEYILFGEKKYKSAKSISGIVKEAILVPDKTCRISVAVHDEPVPISMDVPVEILGEKFFEDFAASKKDSDYFVIPILEFGKEGNDRQYTIPVDWRYRNETQKEQEDFMRNDDDNKIAEEIVIAIRAVAELFIPISAIILFVNAQLAVVCIGISIAGILCFTPSKSNRKKCLGIIVPDFQVLFPFLKLESPAPTKMTNPIETKSEKPNLELVPEPKTEEVESEAKAAINALLRQSDIQKSKSSFVESEKELSHQKKAKAAESVDSAQKPEENAASETGKTDETQFMSVGSEEENPSETSKSESVQPDSHQDKEAEITQEPANDNSGNKAVLKKTSNQPLSILVSISDGEATEAEKKTTEGDALDGDNAKGANIKEGQEADKKKRNSKTVSAKKRTGRKKAGNTTAEKKKKSSCENNGQLTFDFVTQNQEDDIESDKKDLVDETFSGSDVVVLPPKQEHVNKYGDSLIKKKKSMIDYEINSYQ